VYRFQGLVMLVVEMCVMDATPGQSILLCPYRSGSER